MMEQRRSILIFGAVFLALVCPSSEVRKNNVRRGETGSTIAADEIPESNQHEEDDYYQEFLGVPMASSTDDFGVKGRPGIDFPNLATIPITSFTCRNVKESGYFADMETKCQVFHICDGGRKMSFLCPNGTVFRQSHLICDWWFRVDCDDSQNFYEPSADTLRRDRNRAKQDRDRVKQDRDRVKLDRLPSESRESMSITTEFESPVNLRSNTQGIRNFYETTQPLYSGNQRSTTTRTIVEPGDERNSRNDKTRKSNSQNSQYFELEQQHAPQSRQRDSDRRRTRVNFRSQNDEYIPRAQIKLVNDEDIIRAPKQVESRVKPSPYFEPEELSKRVTQNYDRDSEAFDSERVRSSTSDAFTSANRRVDTVRRKNKNCIHDESEGQVVAETSSFAGSHRRGRLESVTFSQISDDIPIFEIPSKEEETDSAVTGKPSKEEEIDLVVTYKPPKEDETESVVTYRPVMDLEKFLYQRREKLTKIDDDVEVNGKPYAGARIPPNIPISSGPGAVHSLALYIATGGDNLVYNTPRRIEGSLKGVITTDPIPEQPKTSSSPQKTTPVSLKSSARLPQPPTTTANYRLVSFSNENESPSSLEVASDQKISTTSSPVIITAPNRPYFEYTTKSPIFNLEASNLSQKVSETNSPSNSPSTKDIPYVLVKTSLSGRRSKIVATRGKSSNIQYLPTTEFTTVYVTENTVTEKISLKNTESPSLDINLVTTFLPKDTNIPSEVSYRSLNKNSDLVNIRNPIISSLIKKDYFQEANKTNKAAILSENKGRSLIDSAQYSTDQVEYTNTQRPTTRNEAEGTSFFEKEQYFRLDKKPTTTKDSGAYFSKQLYSKAEVNNKKSEEDAKKMKDYLLGNFTSDNSGLFQHINKALSETNTTNLTEDTMNILYKNAIEPTLKEAMSVTEPIFPETVPTTEENLLELHTENPNTTEDVPNSTTETEENQKTKIEHSDTIQITPFFKLENGKITSTSSKFPQDDDLSTTPSDLRELAQVFSRALSAYLEDPETFREALSSVSHPPNPTLPSGVLSDSHENLSNASVPDEEDDEVLDFSDVQISTTTTVAPQKTETTTPKPQSGFYITIPFTSTTTNKTPQKSSNFNNPNKLSQQDAEGPNSDSIQPITTAIPEIVTPSAVINKSRSLLAQLRTENGNDTSNISPQEKEKENVEEVSKSETITVKIPETKLATESDILTYEEPSYTTLPSGKPLTENLPPLEIDLLPPFQDPIPEHEETEAEEEKGFTEINIPTAALDELLNEFVPEELNRLAMTSINPDEIPDSKNNYINSFSGSLEPNSLSTYDFQNSEQSSTPSSTTSSTTPIPPVTESQDGHDLLTRLTAKLPQGKSNGVTSPINTVSYNTYANQLLKTVTNSVTEQGESLIRAQSANFLPSQPISNTFQGHIADKIAEQSTSALDESNSSPTEEFFNEKTTPTSLENLDYEFINTTTKRDSLEFPNVEPQTLNTTEDESLPEMKEERSFQGNPRLVLLFVNDHNAKGRGINEKNARLLRALLRKDDHQILRNAGLIPDDSREPTTTTTEYNPYTIMPITPKSHTTQKTTTNNPKPSPGKDRSELRTEPPITTYAPKFTMAWLPFKKPRSTSKNETLKAEKLQATEPTTLRIETTTPRIIETSTSPSSLPEIQTTDLPDTTSILSVEDKSTVSDGRAFDLLRSLYSLTARWG